MEFTPYPSQQEILHYTVGRLGISAVTDRAPTSLHIAPVLTLAIDPLTPTILYAGTLAYTYPGTMRYVRGGIFKSTNGGRNWTEVNAGLTCAIVNALAIDPAMPTTLYVGTNGGGVIAVR